MTFMTQQKHHSNNLDMSGPGLAKHVYEEGIISMLASTEFPPTSFSWKILKTQPAKTEASRFGGFLLHWKHSKKDMLSGIQYAILFLPKKTLIALQYYDTACWTRNKWIQTKIQASFQQRCAAVPRGLVVLASSSWWEERNVHLPGQPMGCLLHLLRWQHGCALSLVRALFGSYRYVDLKMNSHNERLVFCFRGNQKKTAPFY